MKLLKFNARKSWWFGHDIRKCISIETSGCDQTPHISLKLDGDERHITLHVALFIGVWITFERFLPNSWYPTRISKAYGPLPDERVFKIYWFESAIWWNFWMPEDEWNSTDPKWRRGSIHFDQIIRGKHKMEKIELEREKFLLPFFEGSYEVEVIKYSRLDKYQRRFTRKSIAYDVTVISANGIPHEGKGESSWDCDESYTSSSWFPGNPVNPDLRNCYDAALYFWKSCMKTRERYGSPMWTPKKFEGKEIQMA